MWSLPLLFFGFQFILRLFPGLVMPDFLAKYHITATDFGLFASLYYLGYAGMQIPIAILLDKFGPRLIICLSALLCGLACILTTQSDLWILALLSRFLIGIGSVVGFLGTSKIISNWFSSQQYGRLVGFTFSFGLLGAIYGGKPVSLLIEKMGFESVLFVLGCVSIFISLFVCLLLKNKQTHEKKTQSVISTLKFVLTKPSIIVLAISSLMMVGSLEGFADVWGVPYLMAARSLSKPDAAGIVSYIFIGMLFGGPILTYFADKFRSDYKVIFACGLLMAVLLSYFLYCNEGLSLYAMKTLMFVIGILCCYQVLVFAVGSKLVSPGYLGVTIAFLNCINMLGGLFFHRTIGILMDSLSDTHLMNGIVVYEANTFVLALIIVPLCSVVGAIGILFSQYQLKKEQLKIVPLEYNQG